MRCPILEQDYINRILPSGYREDAVIYRKLVAMFACLPGNIAASLKEELDSAIPPSLGVGGLAESARSGARNSTPQRGDLILGPGRKPGVECSLLIR